MKLYEYDEKIKSCIDEETGEITDLELLEALMKGKEEKIEGIAILYKNAMAEADAISNEIKTLTARKRTAENYANRLKHYISDALAGQKFKTPKVSIGFRKSTTLEIEDVYKLPVEFVVYADPTAKKEDIKNAIKNGAVIEGARLVEHSNAIIK